MDLKSLRLYLMVLEYGSITKASERAHITQPALGLHIRKLEAEIGVPLLERHSRGVVVTEAGRMFAVHAENILKTVDDTKFEMMSYARMPMGHVSIGLTPTAREAVAAPLVASITKEFPGVTVTLKEALSETLTGYLLESRIDVALLYNTREGGEQLSFEPLALENMYFIYSREHDSDRIGDTIEAADAIAHNLILPTRPHMVRTEVDRIAEKLNVRQKLAHEVDSVPAIRSFISKGLGWSIMPRPPSEDPTVGCQLVVNPQIRRILHLARPKRRPISRAFEAVVKTMREVVEAETNRPDGQWQPLEAPHQPT